MLDYSLVETPPTIEPVALGEARDHVALGHECDDGLLSRLIAAARAVVEKETRSRLITREVVLRLHGSALAWSARCPLASPIGPVQSVGESKGVVGGQETTLASPSLDAPGQLVGRFYWPSGAAIPAVDFVPGGWRLKLSVGYGDSPASVPAPLKQAILLLVGHWYEQREQSIGGTIINEIPRGVDSLLSLYTVC